MKISSAPKHEASKVFRPGRGSTWRRWLMPVLFVAAAVALQALAKRNPQWVERHYSRRVFPLITRTLSLINNLVDFSIAELMIYVLAVALLIALVYQVREIYLRRRRLSAVVRTGLLVLLWATGCATMLFLIVWGFNYQREPLRSSLGDTGRKVSGEQLKKISETIVNELNSNYDQSHDVQMGVAQPSRAQVYECLAFYEDHRGEIDVLVARQMAPGEPV